MRTIINAAPGFVDLGVDDQSEAPYTRTPEEIPQHLPKFLIYAKKGPSVLDKSPEKLLGGNERNAMYGTESFVIPSKYFTHPVIYANAVNAVGNSAMYVRLLGKNHGPKPTIRAYLDVLPTKVDLYLRNTDGSMKLDVAGNPQITGQTDGYRVKWVIDHANALQDEANFGSLNSAEGDQTDAATGVKSTRYPIFEQRHSYYGEDGNLAGIRLWPQNIDNTGSLPSKMINKHRAYPFNYAVVRKNTTTGNSKPVTTIFNETQIMVTFKEDVSDPLTTRRLHVSERLIDDYQNITDPRYPEAYGEFGELKVYQENIDLLLGLFHAAEAPHIDSTYDFTADPSEKYMFNFVTGTNTKNNPYHAFVFVDSVDSVRFSASTNVFAQGGSDGEMNHDNHAEAVAEYMERYADVNDELMDLAYHVESHFYDSGFPLEAKYAAINFIAERKDTFIHLTPFEFGERELTASEEYAVANALMSRLVMYPESTYFGTPVFRGMIQGTTGKIRNGMYKKPVSTNYEIAIKSAKYMGAGHGRFKGEYRFEGYPGHVLDSMYDLSIRWVPDSVRVRNWDAGLGWVGRFDRKQFYFPSFKTVYSEDTSVLTSYLTACIFIRVNKALAKCQRVFTGHSDLTLAQFSKQVNDWMSEELNGIFDNRVIIKPKAHFTSLDQIRNYTWTVPVEIGAAGAKTVMTGYAVARRIEAMQQENP